MKRTILGCTAMQYSILNGYVEGIFCKLAESANTSTIVGKSNLDVSMQLNVAKN